MLPSNSKLLIRKKYKSSLNHNNRTAIAPELMIYSSKKFLFDTSKLNTFRFNSSIMKIFFWLFLIPFRYSIGIPSVRGPERGFFELFTLKT